MADFCKECFHEEFTVKNNQKIIVSKDMSLCEGCGEIRCVVLKVKKKNIFGK